MHWPEFSWFNVDKVFGTHRDSVDDWEREELAEKEREYRKNPPAEVEMYRDPDEDLPVR
jgi:hypothetical protein